MAYLLSKGSNLCLPANIFEANRCNTMLFTGELQVMLCTTRSGPIDGLNKIIFCLNAVLHIAAVHKTEPLSQGFGSQRGQSLPL